MKRAKNQIKNRKIRRPDFNEVTIIVNGEIIAKSVGRSPSLEMLTRLVGELQRRETDKHDD